MKLSSFFCLAAGFTLANCANQAQNALTFAYAYGYPLSKYSELINTFYKSRDDFHPNVILDIPEPAEAGSTSVIRPSVDTKDWIVFIDLSQSDVTITVPKMPKNRFWVFPVSTPYGDNLFNLGSLEGTSAGDYLITYDIRAKNLKVDTENAPQGYAGVIRFPMPYGLSRLRIGTYQTKKDLTVVRSLQKRFKIRTKPNARQLAPPLAWEMFNSFDPSATYLERVMGIIARISEYALPYISEDIYHVRGLLRQAGVRDGSFKQPAGTDLEAAATSAYELQKKAIDDKRATKMVGNDWFIFNDGYIGAYGLKYLTRYHAALTEYSALVPKQIVYPSRHIQSTVEEGQSLLFTFTEKPKLAPSGFWSLTAYGPDQRLVENDLQRYSLGDKDNLTYPDGSPLKEGDDAFQILLQATETAPPSNWTNNWLPIAPGGGALYLALRWYGPDASMTDGSYVYPAVDVIDAIV